MFKRSRLRALIRLQEGLDASKLGLFTPLAGRLGGRSGEVDFIDRFNKKEAKW